MRQFISLIAFMILTSPNNIIHADEYLKKIDSKKCSSIELSNYGIVITNLIKEKNNHDRDMNQYIRAVQPALAVAIHNGNINEQILYESKIQKLKKKSSDLHNQIIHEMHIKAILDLKGYRSTNMVSKLWSYYEGDDVKVILREDCMYKILKRNEIYKDLINESELINMFNIFKK